LAVAPLVRLMELPARSSHYCSGFTIHRKYSFLAGSSPKSMRNGQVARSNPVNTQYPLKQEKSRPGRPWLLHECSVRSHQGCKPQSDGSYDPAMRSLNSSTLVKFLRYCFFSGSTFGTLFPEGNSPSNALMNAFRKALKMVVSISGFGFSNVPEKGTFVPNRSLG
jgi:hypothetical protein